MHREFAGDYPYDRRELYALLRKDLAALVEGVPQPIPNLANAAALLWQALRDINWAGFYLMEDGQLVLGPFQGKPACIYIPIGKGVCGTAVAENRTQRVDDCIHFPDTSPATARPIRDCRTIRQNGRVAGVLDIDSPLHARFDEVDQEGLESFVSILEGACRFTL